MGGLISWFARNPVAANLLMVVILVAGAWAALTTPLEDFPEFEPDWVSVSVSYPGATPAEVEEAVVVRIEEAIADLPGIRRITSSSREGGGSVEVQVEKGHDVRDMLDEIKMRVDSISTFPEEIERPLVSTGNMTARVVSVLVTGEMNEADLRRVGEHVRDEIQSLDGVTLVDLKGARRPEITIEVSEAELQRQGLTLQQVTEAVRRSSVDLPAGGIKSQGGEIMLRTKGQAYQREDFENIVLRGDPRGSRLLVRDVAEVSDGFDENPLYLRVDGRPAVLVQVYRSANQNILEIANKVRDYLRESAATLPQGVELSLWRDNSENVRSRLSTLLQDAAVGAFLVLVTLALMLRPSLAAWVAIGIPIGFAGGLIVMHLTGVTVNRLTLFGFIIVVGIVVDDAIVCGENIYSHLSRGKEALQAAIDGAREVGVPVVFGVLSNVATFVPILFLPGRLGQIYMQIPAVVIPVFLFSLLESTLILPARLRMMSLRRDSEIAAGGALRWHERLRQRISGGLQWVIRRLYRPLLDRALAHKPLVYAAFTGALLVATGFIAGGHITYTHMPPVFHETISAGLEMPAGTPADVTEVQLRRLHEAARDLKQELAAEFPDNPPILKVMMMMGDRGAASGRLDSRGDTHQAEVTVELSPAETRPLDAGEITERWRQKAGDIIGAQELTFRNQFGRWGNDIEIEIAGTDFEEMARVSQLIQEHLKSYEGVFEVHDSMEEGKPEIRLSLKPEAEHLGLTQTQLARQVRDAFYGSEAQRIQRGRDDLRVMVRYPRPERESVHSLERMKVRTPEGAEVPFESVAEAAWGRSFSRIERVDRRRVMSVMANADTVRVDMQRLQAQVEAFLRDLQSRHPGVSFSFEGAARDQRESWASLWLGIGMALFALYGLMAIPFQSYLQPLIVIAVIPFCIVGAVLGHWLMGMNLSFFSVLGMLAVAGVAVNNGIILVDFINQRVARGIPLLEAVREAAQARFRAIILTSATTFVGLIPVMFSRSTQGMFLAPMAISMGWGIIIATLVTLLLVPLNYVVHHRLFVRGRALPHAAPDMAAAGVS